MALEYFLYRTDFNNTLIDRSDTIFILGANEGQIQINFLIPQGQPLYLYRESGGTIVENSQNTINDFLDDFDPITPDTDVDFKTFSGYTATTNVTINNNARNALYGTGTGLLTGGTITIDSGDTTQVNVASGKGLIIDQYTNAANPIINEVSWSDVTVPVTGISANSITHFAVNINGDIIQREIEFKPAEWRDVIVLGLAVHPSSSILFINNSPLLAYDSKNELYDLMESIGFHRLDLGNKLRPYTGLTIQRDSGNVFKRSFNYINNKKSPNIRLTSPAIPISFAYRDIEGNNSNLITNVDPTQFEQINSGKTTSTIVNITGSSNQATIQRFYLFESEGITAQRGQKIYLTISDAVSNFLNEEDFIEETDIRDDGLLIGILAIRVGAIDLNNKRDALFIPVNRFGGIDGASVDDAYNKIRFQIVRNVDDFPPPNSNDEIFLQDYFQYEVNGSINIENKKIVLGKNNLLFGQNIGTDMIIGNRSDELIFSTGGTSIVKQLLFKNLNSLGKVFNVSGNDDDTFVLRQSIFSETNVGEFKNFNLIQFDSIAINEPTGGIVLSGSSTLNSLNKVKLSNILFEVPNTTITYIKVLESNFSAINIANSYFELESNAIGIDVDSGVTVNAGNVLNNEFISSGTTSEGIALTGITVQTPRWNFSNNIGLTTGNIITTNIFGFLRFMNNSTPTTINSTVLYFKASGTNNSDTVGVRFLVNIDNRLTYNGDVDNKTFIIIATGDIFTNNNNQNLRIAIFKNSVENIVEGGVIAKIASEPVPYALNGIVTLDIGDYIEVFVRNVTQARDIILKDLQIRINEP